MNLSVCITYCVLTWTTFSAPLLSVEDQNQNHNNVIENTKIEEVKEPKLTTQENNNTTVLNEFTEADLPQGIYSLILNKFKIVEV